MRALAYGTALLGALAAGCGANTDVGTVSVPPYIVQVKRGGDIEPGGTEAFSVRLGVGTFVDAVQMWYGEGNQMTGHVIASFDVRHGRYGADVPIPDPIPADAMLWMIIVSGTVTVVGSIRVE